MIDVNCSGSSSGYPNDGRVLFPSQRPVIIPNHYQKVVRRFFCRSAQRADVGDSTVTGAAETCEAARSSIQGDPCRSYDSSYWAVAWQEIQIAGCPLAANAAHVRF